MGAKFANIAHLLAVSATVLEYGGDEDLAIAALLLIVSRIKAARHGWRMSATGSGIA
jgi:hypothetical protein